MDKGIIMHETKSPGFTGYIDNFLVDNNNLRISGWLVSNYARERVTYYVDIGRPVAFYNYNERSDVANFYNNTKFLNSGFDITIPKPNVSNIAIYAIVDDGKIDSQREEIFVLNLDLERREIPESSLVDEVTSISISKKVVPQFLVVDNFYEDPDAVRALALSQDFAPDIRYHKGNRTSKKFLAPNTRQIFESLLGRKITNWSTYEYNGVFQFCTAEDPLVYHSDVQSYAAAVYLTPDAPPETGTSFFRSKRYPDIRQSHVDDANYGDVFKGGYYDKTQFELVDTVGNVYNRLAMWNSKLIHSASQYFGTNKYDSRLFHLFFFDIEE